MMLTFTGMKSTDAEKLWNGGQDSHGNTAEKAISDGKGNPCRHCLEMIKEGEAFLIVSHRPFAAKHAYAEQGPVFVHAEPCIAYDDFNHQLPSVLQDSPHYLVRGYSQNERIVYGTGGVVDQQAIIDRAKTLFENPSIAFIDIRSAQNNCWQARIQRD